ncbi:metallophosphoesterase [Chloroflexi bacterium TSY]|nr:metallophosphoesterase [Chloroflexi bacterium TSY]
MPTKYYVVSDLHMGGDGQLQVCDYTDEFIQFLGELEASDEEIELIILGDTFGFWEFTEADGTTMLEEIIRHHQPIYDALSAVGAKHQVTMLPGNHDYDLACVPEYATILEEYNINLDTSRSTVREVAGKKIWLEHGQQYDGFNLSPDYGNLYARPIGYFITAVAVSGASRLSDFGHGNWLKDIRSTGTMQIPEWAFSNYFYREMSRPLRWLLLPFLLLFGFTILALLTSLLERFGWTESNILIDNFIFRWLRLVNLLGVVVIVNTVVILPLLILGIPLFFVFRDLRRTLRRYQLIPETGRDGEFDLDDVKPYVDGALQVFAENPDVAVFVFGHTYGAFLHKFRDEVGERVILNTGSWLKILDRVGVRFGLLPPVYVPRFRLSYFVFEAENDGLEDGNPGSDKLVINYVDVDKAPTQELTILQRILLFGKKPAPVTVIPAQTVLS